MANDKSDNRIHIFVNRRKFEEGDGVKPHMTGAEIAQLVNVSADMAIIRWDTGPHKGEEIPSDKRIEVKNGDHFLVTRKVVEGG